MSCFLDIWAFSIINPAANHPPPCLTQSAEPGSWRPCIEQGCSFRQSWFPKPVHKLTPRTSAELGMQLKIHFKLPFHHNAGFPRVWLSVLVGCKCSIYSLFHTRQPHIYFPFLGFCMAILFPARGDSTVGLGVQFAGEKIFPIKGRFHQRN